LPLAQALMAPSTYACVRTGVLAALVLSLATAAVAQVQPPDDAPQPPPQRPAEIDLNVVNLPTTMSLKRHQSYFRLTHRFARDLANGSFGSVVEDLFGLDNGAVIGFEYRFAVTGNLHAGAHRSMLSKTIHTFGHYNALRQGGRLPFSLSIGGGVEGLNNLQDDHQPSVMATLSHTRGDVLALYATPAFVGRTKAADFLSDDHGHEHDLGEVDEHAHHDETVFVGLGARLRFRPTAYVSAEFTPRVYGYDPNQDVWAVAIEKFTRGHILSICFTNSFGTTPGQLSRGGNADQVYLGFNITRRF
jgi:hypothetical protein